MDTEKIPYDLLQKYDRPVPRYTSFPTAVQFTDCITQDDCAAYLSGIDVAEAASLYIHIPFCHQLCHYCGCNTKIVNSYSPVKNYLDLLYAEVRAAGEYLPKDLKISRLHFGGGSPNFLEADDLYELLGVLSRFARLDAAAVIDMEMDPRLLTPEKIRRYAAMGVRRASLGIQDFDPHVQSCINRIQPFEKVRECVEALREEGIAELNFDLITGLPEQTPETVLETAEKSVSLDPDRFSVFGYAHVPWMKKHQLLLEAYRMPDARQRFEMNALLGEYLRVAGYDPVGMDHFAKKDDPLFKARERKALRRNFQGYTDDAAEVIIGFGLSSISSFGGAYRQNMTDAPEYRSAVEKGMFPVKRGCILTAEDRRRRSLIEEIMCYSKADLKAYADIPYLLEQNTEQLAALEKDGLLQMDGSVLTVTERGQPFVRIVAACFDPYFQPSERRHAKAV